MVLILNRGEGFSDQLSDHQRPWSFSGEILYERSQVVINGHKVTLLSLFSIQPKFLPEDDHHTILGGGGLAVDNIL